MYDLTLNAAGFKSVIQKGIKVEVAQTVRRDFTLEIGSATESVTVTGEAAQLQTESAEQSLNFNGDYINDLPLNFGGGGGSTGSIRNAFSFISLEPGTSGSGIAYGSRINGQPGDNFKVLIEGLDTTSANDTGWSSGMLLASMDMIQEFQLQTSNFAAEFGQVSGGLFNFTIKSGTNQFHGSGFEYLTNEALDAHKPFTAGARPRSRKNDFGGTIGGPVWIPKLYNGRNKTFFFLDLRGNSWVNRWG